ncbi:insulin-like growth factor-binding protein complex acid labile subunit [Anopheles ziemanni]|uniref:insulin-like growth factor-binding protein complex acid labile subunit n=1 Tax=Anopheles coustani TaxID=139045 RepID=UPI002658300C|nr:insulin-like growth factor-binding protein complex acid labile subunit [Anopheles coustani]XP_058168976.1 insulin-like growth factor-binding protein complex acid labile subunit [Anopheles ziemanni]
MVPQTFSILRVITLAQLLLLAIDDTAAGEQSYALLDCPPECLCDRNQAEVSAGSNGATKSQQHYYPADGQPTADFDDPAGEDYSVHALCMIGRGAGFEAIEDLLSLDTSVLKIVYTSQTERFQLNASNLARFGQLRELHVQSLQPQLLRFEIDTTLPVERLHLEAVDLVRTKPPLILDRSAPSASDLGLSKQRTTDGDVQGNNEANIYHVVGEEMEIVMDDGADGGEQLTETFEVEIVPYEVYKRELASTSNVSFFGWNNLTALSIHDCQLESLHPDFLYGLAHLVRLSLQHNNIKVLPPFAFYGAPNMRLLSLADNRLLEVSYYSLAGLLELRVLDLSGNNISKVSELTFPPFPKLTKLDLRQNPIEYVFDSSFAIANMTRSLFIGSETVGLQIRTPKPFQGLTQLELLEVRNLRVDALNQYLFRGLRAVRTLRLIQGNIPFVEYDSFAEMKNLTELYASRCGIGAVSMDAFFGVKRLRTIDLSYNLLAELPVGLFDEQLQLLELYLQGNRLTKLPTEFFRRLAPAVQVVRLIENPWLCSCTMVEWRQAATNRLKVASTGSYVYSSKLTPRCSDPAQGIYNRTVYYVIRKNLPCNSHKTFQPTRRITELNHQKQETLIRRRLITAAKTIPPAALRPIVVQQTSFENPIPRHSLLYEQKRRRLQQKLHHSQRYAAPAPPGQRTLSNDIEY